MNDPEMQRPSFPALHVYNHLPVNKTLKLLQRPQYLVEESSRLLPHSSSNSGTDGYILRETYNK